MRGLITLGVLFFASVISASPIARSDVDISPLVEVHEEVNIEDPRHRWSLIPDGDGKMHLIDLNTYQSEPEPIQPTWNADVDVFFLLCTHRNWGGARVGINADQIRNNGFNAGAPVRVIIHGWNNNGGSDVNIQIRDAYLNRGDFNVFIVDWGAGAQTIDYGAARWRIDDVATQVGRLVDHLIQNGMTNHGQTTIIGHSLGGHTAGIAGKKINGNVQTIIGLDPAGPLFSMGSPGERIDPNDANYVEIIHTNAWTLGFGEPLGNSDFYPNWGRSQPGCGIDLVGTCAHGRAPTFFAESINNHYFYAIRCANFNEVDQGRCSNQGGGFRMGGEPSNNGLNGIFYLETNSNSPFARG